MRQMGVISGHPIFIGFRKLTGCQRDPRDRGVTLIVFTTSTFFFPTCIKKNLNNTKHDQLDK